MRTRTLRTALPVLLAGALGLPPAHADIFTWVDASGSLNVSNLAPPEGVRVTSVIHASPAANPPRDAAREALREAEVQVLAQQVRQLQDEVEQARQEAPVAYGYPGVPPLPAEAYASDWAPPVQYAYEAAPMTSVGCDPAWMNCGLGWAPAVYPAAVVLRAPRVRRPYPVQIGHRHPAPPPMHPAIGYHRG